MPNASGSRNWPNGQVSNHSKLPETNVAGHAYSGIQLVVEAAIGEKPVALVHGRDDLGQVRGRLREGEGRVLEVLCGDARVQSSGVR